MVAHFGGQNMNDWQSTYLGRSALPRDLSGFEIEAFLTYSEPERRVIDDERRAPALKLALALQIGFLRMTGRLLEALRMVPPVLLRHLGAQFEIEAPDLASLRTMYRRRRTLFRAGVKYRLGHLSCGVASRTSKARPNLITP
jgi:uncharacterized protein DUF4158